MRSDFAWRFEQQKSEVSLLDVRFFFRGLDQATEGRHFRRPFQLVLSIGVKHLGIQSYAQTFQATRLFKCKGSNGNHMPYLYLDAIGTTMDRKVYRSIIFSVLYLFVHFDWMSFCVYVPVYGTKQLRRDPHSGCQEVLCLTYSYTYTSTSRLHLVEM